MKNREIEEFVPPQYIKNSRKFPGNRKISRERTGNEFSGKFPGIPGREFPGDSPTSGGLGGH